MHGPELVDVTAEVVAAASGTVTGGVWTGGRWFGLGPATLPPELRRWQRVLRSVESSGLLAMYGYVSSDLYSESIGSFVFEVRKTPIPWKRAHALELWGWLGG